MCQTVASSPSYRSTFVCLSETQKEKEAWIAYPVDVPLNVHASAGDPIDICAHSNTCPSYMKVMAEIRWLLFKSKTCNKIYTSWKRTSKRGVSISAPFKSHPRYFWPSAFKPFSHPLLWHLFCKKKNKKKQKQETLFTWFWDVGAPYTFNHMNIHELFRIWQMLIFAVVTNSSNVPRRTDQQCGRVTHGWCQSHFPVVSSLCSSNPPGSMKYEHNTFPSRWQASEGFFWWGR